MSPRSRRYERLRALSPAPAGGPRPLHESPAAQRLRSRIPRPPLADSPVPAAPYAVNEVGTEYRPELPRAVVSPAHRGPRGLAAGKAAAPGRRSEEERTPLTALLEGSDTERLPPPSGARRAGAGAAPVTHALGGGFRTHTSAPPHPSEHPAPVEPPSSSTASTVGELSTPSATDPDGDLLDGTGTTRLRPRRALSPHTTEPAGPIRRTGPAEAAYSEGGTASTRHTGAPGNAGHTGTGEPPISADVLRNHRDLHPMIPSSGPDEHVRPHPRPHTHEDFPGPGDTVRLHPRAGGPGPGHPTSSATPRGSATRKWVGHRPLGQQPRQYRRPSWPAGPPSGEQRSTASADWPDRDPEDTVTVPGPAPATGAEGHPPEPQGSPWLDPDDEETLKERRPPSGYVEFDTGNDADTPMNLLARWWGPNATLSKRAVIVLFVLGAAAVVAALLFLRREPEEVDVPEMVSQTGPDGEDGDDETSGEGSGPAPDEDVVVHVGGDVEDPGLYTLPPGARVLDAVEEAGGALPDADLDLVNLARPVVDGEQIMLGAEAAGEDAEGGGGAEGQRVSLNQADGAALETLPGIGEAKAEAILEHRESLGGSFSSVEDLMDVSGIGQSTFDNLEEHVTL